MPTFNVFNAVGSEILFMSEDFPTLEDARDCLAEQMLWVDEDEDEDWFITEFDDDGHKVRNYESKEL